MGVIDEPFDWEGVGERMRIARSHLELTKLGGRHLSTSAIADALREFRMVDDLQMKVTASSVSEWLRGATPAKPALLLAYAMLCGVDPGWLAFGPGLSGAHMVRERGTGETPTTPAAPAPPRPPARKRRARR